MRQLSVALRALYSPGVAAASLSLMLTLLSANVAAQQSSGLSGALQALGGMSSDQQQQIMQRVMGSSNGGSTSPTGTNGSSQFPVNGNIGTNPTQNSGPGSTNNQPISPIPVFGPDDTVLIDINLPGERTVAQLSADTN